jgi:cellobiose phosphorylase
VSQIAFPEAGDVVRLAMIDSKKPAANPSTPRAVARPPRARTSAAGAGAPAVGPSATQDYAAGDELEPAAPHGLGGALGARGADAAAASQAAADRARYFMDVQRDQWRYYADHVGAATNHLPPDNVRVEQGKPAVVDHRTSPTNIGLYMLCTVTAQQLGYIDQGEALARLRDTVATLKKLPKYTGTVTDAAGAVHPVEHLYNWYSIDGQPKEIGAGFISTVDNGNFVAFLVAIVTALGDADPKLTAELKDMIGKMRFDVFYDPHKGLLRHGANVTDGKLNLTAGSYDMVITEARCAYATAIMLGQIPKKAWTNMKTKLGKEIDGLQVNKSLPFQAYTGTMFEYLTPRLLMKHDGTPFGAADEQAVQVQMSEVAGGIWGKSEANSNTSQGYSAFGARCLSQSREFLPVGLDVIAPYASQMATGLAPERVQKNLEKMEEVGLRGKYGFYESATVRKRGKAYDYDVCPQFYAHHIGMGMLGTANHLLRDVVTDWFHGSEYNEGGAIEALLRTPVTAYAKPATKRPQEAALTNAYAYERQVTYDKAEIVGNGQFVSHVKSVGGSTWVAQSYALSHNEVFYVRDDDSGQLLPLKLDAPDRVITTDRGRRFEYDVPAPGGGKLGIGIDISVSAETRAKIARVIVQNQSGRPQRLSITGGLDWIMDDVNAYLGHPVYRNLYVETERDAESGAVVARRRTMQGPEQDRQPYGFFAIAGAKADWADSSRTSIVGRLGSLMAPAAVTRSAKDDAHGGVFGATLDPAAALGKSLHVPAGETSELAFVAGVADDRAAIPAVVKQVERELKNPKAPRGVPHYPPDTSHAKMLELAQRTERSLRIRPSGKVARGVSDSSKGEPIHRFEDGGRVVVVTDPAATKKPWSMVASNGTYGFVATASGWAYSFGGNSQQNRITPYMPDNTTELPLRGVVVKDRATGKSFSIAPNPAPGDGQYSVEMAPGSIKYVYRADDGLVLSMTQFVAKDDPCELWQIDIENGSNTDRDLELASFLKWALGASYPANADKTKVTVEGGVVFAESPDSILPGSVAFHALVADGKVVEKDLFGTKSDPFSGLAVDLKVAKGGKQGLAFVLGQATSKAEAQRVLGRYGVGASGGAQGASKVTAALDVARGAVRDTLDTLQVKTPDGSFDVMMNTWLPYQAYYAHYLARSGFYQSGGAYGFRDQLQTVMNLLDSGSPFFKDVARSHIIESARHQFPEGDVQHWWHPHNNLGQRSTITDNLLWLPLALAHYAEVTGDHTILDEQAQFSVARPLNAGELDHVAPMPFSEQTASMYDHATRAIDLVLKRIGSHGLPLIGKGDWNDGLDRVGHLGKGESVWLAFFAYDVLQKFAGVADQRGDVAVATRYREEARKLQASIDKHAWHGGHYLRAWADSGDKVDFNDAIVQSWAVLSGAADGKRAVEAVASAVKDLYDDDAKTILLFDKVLDKEEWGGSLAAYPNGLRENNAQYTHGSSWLPRAVAQLGDGDWAMKLFGALLPTVHADDPRYGAEPYVVAADIYGGAKAGEGGWTWYSGGPSWIYRTGIELILGLQFKDGDKLKIDPCIPRAWPSFQATHQKGASLYTIDVQNPESVSKGVNSIRVDGKDVDPAVGIQLVDDGKPHKVEVVMGAVPGVAQFSLDDALAADR